MRALRPSLIRRLSASLHNPCVVLTLGAFCLGAAILIANDVAIRKGNSAATKAAEQHTETLSRALRDQLDARLAAVEGLVQLVAAEAQWDGMEVTALRMARMVAGRGGKFAEFSLFDAAGEKIWESRALEISPEIVAAHFAAHQQDGQRLHVSPASWLGNAAIWTFYLSYPVAGRDGKLLGLTLVSVNVAQLQQIHGGMNLGAGGTLLLLLGLLARQQAAQSALRSSESRFKALSALGSDWYWEADTEYRLTQISEGFSRIAGGAAEEMLGKSRWEHTFITPVGSDWTAHKAVIARRASFRSLILRYTSPQGVVAYGSLNGEPVFREDGTLAGYRGVGNDITAKVV